MKKLLLLLGLFTVVLTLSGCVVEDDEPRDNEQVEDQNEGDQDPDQESDPLERVHNELESVFNEFTVTDLMFYKYENAVADTNITNIYVGRNEAEEDIVYVIRNQYMGRWDNVIYIMVIDVQTETFLGVDILFHNENWGSFIELDSFLDQFIDKDINHYLDAGVALGVDGDAAATTTISGFDNTLDSAINYYLDNIK